MKIIGIIILLLIVVNSDLIDLNISLDSNTTEEESDREHYDTALSKKNLKYCSVIKNKDKKIECFGVIKRDSGYCNMIKDEDLKNRCLAIALSDKQYCDKIQDDKIKNECKSLEIGE